MRAAVFGLVLASTAGAAIGCGGATQGGRLPPDTAIDDKPASITNQPHARITFHVNGVANSFLCQLDAGGPTPCLSPFEADVADGEHVFAVRAQLNATSDSTPAMVTWRVDTVAPDTEITAAPAAVEGAATAIAFAGSDDVGPVHFECALDGGAFAACTAPHALTVADGDHEFAVRAVDAAGNADPTPASARWTARSTAPLRVVIDDAPPALWPVDYFDMQFHASDPAAALECSLDGAAFEPCESPLPITTRYDLDSTFAVRATAPDGETATAEATWTSRTGLVLHYPWEQGRTHNTSLLAQRPSHSPDGSAPVTPIGGWAGTAAGAPAAHSYKATSRALSSSPSATYTASVWVRVVGSTKGGAIFSTLARDNGIQLSVGGRQVTLVVNEADQAFAASAVIPIGEWVHLALVTTGTAKGLQLFVNGVFATSVTPPRATGFGAGQANDLIVGSLVDVDLDDLRFYNRALGGSELCTTLLRGQLDAKGSCVPLLAGLELDFERGQILDTGHGNLVLGVPQQAAFPATTLGTGLQLTAAGQAFGVTQGLANELTQAPGHSVSLWFVAGSIADTLFDFLHACTPTAGFQCGVRASYAAGAVTVVANGGSVAPFTVTIPAAPGAHSLVVTEQKVAGTATTQSLSIYLDGVRTLLPIGTGNVFGSPSDTLQLARNPGFQLDELELWPRDLSQDPEMLCENGWDGEWNPATVTCALTAN